MRRAPNSRSSAFVLRRGGYSPALLHASPTHASTLSLTHTAPNTELLAVCNRELQAVDANDTAPTDLFCFAGG
jgi:hypothetical protein